MSSERNDSIIPQEAFLFQNGFSLDGRVSKFSSPVQEKPPIIAGDMLAYAVNTTQHLSPYQEHILYEVPTSITGEVTTGVTFASVTRDKRDGSISDYSLNIRPGYNESLDHTLQLFTTLHNIGIVQDHAHEVFENLIPSCSVDAERIALTDRSGVIFAYGPNHSLEVSENLAEQLRDRTARIYRKGGNLSQLEYLVMRADITRPDDNERSISQQHVIHAGLRVHVPTFAQIQESLKTVFEKGLDIDMTVPYVLEPYYKHTMKKLS